MCVKLLSTLFLIFGNETACVERHGLCLFLKARNRVNKLVFVLHLEELVLGDLTN